jgi:hypothetical protein
VELIDFYGKTDAAEIYKFNNKGSKWYLLD